MSEKLGIEGFDLRARDEETHSSLRDSLEAEKNADKSPDDNTTVSQRAAQDETAEELEQRANESTGWLNNPERTEE